MMGKGAAPAEALGEGMTPPPVASTVRPLDSTGDLEWMEWARG